MNGTTKFVIGAAVTSLMAMGAHSAVGLGKGFIDKLDAEARSRLSAEAVPGVTVAMQTQPALERVVLLSGPATDAEKARLIAAMKAIPGVANARWADGGPAAAPTPAPATPPPATPEQVQSCQSGVDAVAAGKTIPFETGKSTVKADAAPLIAALAEALKTCAGTTVEVAGHTDITGTAAANQILSQARADAVRSALVAQGAPADRLVARGYGSSKPRVAGTGSTADAANRRIDFTVNAAPAA